MNKERKGHYETLDRQKGWSRETERESQRETETQREKRGCACVCACVCVCLKKTEEQSMLLSGDVT